VSSVVAGALEHQSNRVKSREARGREFREMRWGSDEKVPSDCGKVDRRDAQKSHNDRRFGILRQR
jgi:hypothetical protein